MSAKLSTHALTVLQEIERDDGLQKLEVNPAVVRALVKRGMVNCEQRWVPWAGNGYGRSVPYLSLTIAGAVALNDASARATPGGAKP